MVSFGGCNMCGRFERSKRLSLCFVCFLTSRSQRGKWHTASLILKLMVIYITTVYKMRIVNCGMDRMNSGHSPTHTHNDSLVKIKGLCKETYWRESILNSEAFTLSIQLLYKRVYLYIYDIYVGKKRVRINFIISNNR